MMRALIFWLFYSVAALGHGSLMAISDARAGRPLAPLMTYAVSGALWPITALMAGSMAFSLPPSTARVSP